MKIQEDAYIAGFMEAVEQITSALRENLVEEGMEDPGEYPVDEEDRKTAKEAFDKWEKENG